MEGNNLCAAFYRLDDSLLIVKKTESFYLHFYGDYHQRDKSAVMWCKHMLDHVWTRITKFMILLLLNKQKIKN